VTPFRISGVSFCRASSIDERDGLLGWSSFTLNDAVRVSSVAVRRTRSGSHALAFPTRRDRHGVEHGIVSPVSDASRRSIEALVLADLRRQGVLP
jgi:DNA-binding cell septation regulator SpoVG